MIVELVTGLVFLTAPASPEPVTYFATSGSTTLAYSAYNGWMSPEQCAGRCVTIPNQPAKLLNGELSLRDMADLRIMVWKVKAQNYSFEPWRYAPEREVSFDIWFDGSPICFGCNFK